MSLICQPTSQDIKQHNSTKLTSAPHHHRHTQNKTCKFFLYRSRTLRLTSEYTRVDNILKKASQCIQNFIFPAVPNKPTVSVDVKQHSTNQPTNTTHNHITSKHLSLNMASVSNTTHNHITNKHRLLFRTTTHSREKPAKMQSHDTRAHPGVFYQPDSLSAKLQALVYDQKSMLGVGILPNLKWP